MTEATAPTSPRRISGTTWSLGASALAWGVLLSAVSMFLLAAGVTVPGALLALVAGPLVLIGSVAVGVRIGLADTDRGRLR